MCKTKKGLNLEFSIKISVKGVGLCSKICSSDPANLLIVASAVVEILKKNDLEPTIELQP